MNLRTTAILLVVLLGVVLVLMLTRPANHTHSDEPLRARLLDIFPADVTGLALTGDDGQRIAFEQRDGKWRMIQPLDAPAEDSAVDSLLNSLTALESRGSIEATSVTGLGQPQFKVELKTRDGSTKKLDVGNRSAAGDNLYVRREGQPQADVVPANLYEQLDKPLGQWRRQRLFDVTATDVKQLRIATTQQSVELTKHGEKWSIAGPTSMPADSTEVSDITMAAANLRAVDFIGDQIYNATRYGLDRPVMTVSFSTAAPATQPSTQPTFTTIEFGRFDDVLKRNVFAITSPDGGVVKVAASVLDSFRKTPLELRDKQMLSIDPEHVTKITIDAGTTPVVLERTKQVMGPMLPATMPATTQTATQPAVEPSKWNVASAGGVDADDAKVDELLGTLKPLRAERFLESAPATQPAAAYKLTIETTDARHEIRLIDNGSAQPAVGEYDGVIFEISRWKLESLQGDFVRKHEENAGTPG